MIVFGCVINLTHWPFPLAAWGKFKTFLFSTSPHILTSSTYIVLCNWNYLTSKKSWFFSLTHIIHPGYSRHCVLEFLWLNSKNTKRYKKNKKISMMWLQINFMVEWLKLNLWGNAFSYFAVKSYPMRLSLVFSRTMFCAFFCT